MNLFVVCAFAVAAACAIAVLKQLRPEFAAAAAAVAGTVVLVYIIEGLIPFISFIKSASAEIGTQGYLAVMLKALAVSLCCRMSADICRDCGENLLAARVELAGKAGIVILSLPILNQLFAVAKDMFG